MNDLIFVVIVALATYRVARLITQDSILDGPRDWLLQTWVGRRKIAELAVCPFCVGVWVGVALSLVWFHGERTGRLIVIVIAAIGLQALLSAADERMTE